MKHVQLLTAIVTLGVTVFASFTNLSSPQQPLNQDNSCELIIGLNDVPRSYQNLENLLTEYHGGIAGNISAQNRLLGVVAAIPVATATSPLIDEIRASGLASYVEPNAKVKVVLFEPNDPAWSDPRESWGPKKIVANWAWNSTLGSSTVLVAVVDSGIYYFHEDLSKNYCNTTGYDWVNKDNDPLDDYGHGTRCAGIIAAAINNNKGIAGLAQVRIMAEKVVDAGGYATFADLSNGIINATDAGAKIISMSLGSHYRSSTVYNAIKYAYDHGVLLVAAAGNDNWGARAYPAAFDEVIAVTSTSSQDVKSSFSNYGEWVELAAPGGEYGAGEGIYSTVPPSNYGEASGTSFACPHVVGVAALIWSRFPNMTRDQVRVHLRKTANDLGDPGFDQYFGYGRVNANNSMQSPPDHDVLVLNWKCPPYGKVDTPAVITANVHNYGTSIESNVRVELWVNDTWCVNSTTISSLASGQTVGVNLSWLPWAQKDWNMSCRVVPVSGEQDTKDNKVWTILQTKEPGIIRVSPQSYRFNTIQKAIDAANLYDEIRVGSGTYCEVVNIYKNALKLVGNDNRTTIIDCLGRQDTWGIILSGVQAVQVTNFTVRNVLTAGVRPDRSTMHAGILLYCTGHCRILGNNMTVNTAVDSERDVVSGIQLSLFCRNNTVTGNILTRNTRGITLYRTIGSPSNLIVGNFLSDNINSSIVLESAGCCIIYHNSFLDLLFPDRKHLLNNSASYNQWVGQWGTEGNYWSDYNGTDWNQTRCSIGIGDDYRPWYKVDYRPLMIPWFPGDINHDGVVDITDLCMWQAANGTKLGDPSWDPHADLNEDGYVNSADYSILSANWGKFWEDYWGV
jgi:thermitase